MAKYDFTCVRTIAFTVDCDAYGRTDSDTLFDAIRRRALDIRNEVQEAALDPDDPAEDIIDENGLPPSNRERELPTVFCPRCDRYDSAAHHAAGENPPCTHCGGPLTLLSPEWPHG